MILSLDTAPHPNVNQMLHGALQLVVLHGCLDFVSPRDGSILQQVKNMPYKELVSMAVLWKL